MHCWVGRIWSSLIYFKKILNKLKSDVNPVGQTSEVQDRAGLVKELAQTMVTDFCLRDFDPGFGANPLIISNDDALKWSVMFL